MNLQDDVFGFNAVDVVTMLTAMEGSIRSVENAVEHGVGKYSKADMDRFIDMLDRRRAVLSKVKRYLREMDMEVPNVN